MRKNIKLGVGLLTVLATPVVINTVDSNEVQAEYRGQVFYHLNKPANWWHSDGQDWYFFKDGKKYTGWGKDNAGEHYYVNGKYANGLVQPIKFPQYYQADARWGDKRYGISNMKITGCVPTSLAMVISGLVKDVTPVQVADYIYDTTMEMNTMFTGTSSLGARDAITYWGLKYQVIDSKEDLVAALKSGKIVYGAVGHGIFVKGYSTHAIILSGYDHGKTKAIDPDNMSKTNRWYSVDDIWNERSLELEDNAVGGPFMAVYK